MAIDYMRLAVESYRAGTKKRWLTCFAAMHIVGERDGRTSTLAQELCVSISQVENLARAGLTRKALHKAGMKRDIVERLTISHFTAMGDLWKRYEFSPHYAIEQLRTAADIGASVISMSSAIRGEHGDGKLWGDRWAIVVRECKELSIDTSAPQYVRDIATDVLSL